MPEASSAGAAAAQVPVEAEPSTLSEALSALAQSRAETASLRRALADARRRHVEGVAALEAEEEGISNRLTARLNALRAEKAAVAVDGEREGEAVTLRLLAPADALRSENV